MDDALPSLFMVVSENGEEYLRPFATERRFDELHYESEIERWVKNSLKRGEPILGDIVVIGQQVRFGKGSQRAIDLLAIDEEKNVIVIEFKRGETDETIIFQVLNYCSWAAEQGYDVIAEKASEFIRREGVPYESLRDIYFRSFRAPSVAEVPGEGVVIQEPAEISEEDFRQGFNRNPRVVIVAAAISPEVRRIVSFLSQRSGLEIEAHEFRFYESEKGEKLISRSAISPTGDRRPVEKAPDADWSTEKIEAYVADSAVRAMVRALPQWCEENFDNADVQVYYRRYSEFAVRIAARVRLTFYFAKQHMFVWLNHRFPEDVEWLKQELSRPTEVKVDKYGNPRFHVKTEQDFRVLKELINKILQEVAVTV